jgi:DNA-binding MarR family transcriptional regulator
MLLTQIGDATLKYIDVQFYGELKTSLIKYMVLQGLVMNDGKAKHSELAVWTNTKKHNITALTDRMKEEQLVTTEWSSTDRRVNYVLITDKGRELYELAVPVSRRIARELMKGISASNAQELVKSLNIIKGNIEQR